MKYKSYLQLNGSKILKSCVCFLSYMGLGGAMTLLGSSLLDLQIQIEENFQTISHLIQIRSIGYIIGGILAGVLDNLTNRDATLCVANFLTGISLVVAPWFHKFLGLAAFILFSGITLGILDIYCNVYIAYLWKQESTNYFQVLYMFYGIGALLAPVITRPFLLPIDHDEAIATNSVNTTWDTGFTRADVLIQYPYLIMGVFFTFIAFLFIVSFYSKLTGENVQKSRKTDDTDLRSYMKQCIAVLITAGIANFVFGGQNVVGALGPAFAVKSAIQMTKRSAALLVTVFWSMFSFYRLIFIPLSAFFSEKKLLSVNLIIIIISAILMAPKAAFNQIYTWISFTLLGMGFSPCFAISYGLLQKYFTVTGRMTSFIFLCGCFGESIHPWIVAKFMEDSPEFYVYYLASTGAVCVVLCTLLPFFCERAFSKQSSIGNV